MCYIIQYYPSHYLVCNMFFSKINTHPECQAQCGKKGAADPTLNVTNYWGYVRLSLAGILFIGLGLNPKLKNKVSDLRGAWDLAGPEEVHPHL